MPYFDYSGDIEIDVDEFLSALNDRERQELIDTLVEDGYIINQNSNIDKTFSYGEWEIENALNKLHGKYHNLTKEEEEAIIKISKRF
jgi:DNA-binding winged helix-turn-helix (wHTH) protein